jgi:hypothetical protein
MPASPALEPNSYRPHSAVAVLDPASTGLAATQVAALQVVRMDRFATSVRATAFRAGASRPAVDAGGRFAFIRLEGADLDTGSLWVTSGLDDAGEEILVRAGERPGSLSFAPEPGSLVIGEAQPGGIWLLDLATGHGERLTLDGWLPRWLP